MIHFNFNVFKTRMILGAQNACALNFSVNPLIFKRLDVTINSDYAFFLLYFWCEISLIALKWIPSYWIKFIFGRQNWKKTHKKCICWFSCLLGLFSYWHYCWFIFILWTQNLPLVEVESNTMRLNAGECKNWTDSVTALWFDLKSDVLMANAAVYNFDCDWVLIVVQVFDSVNYVGLVEWFLFATKKYENV